MVKILAAVAAALVCAGCWGSKAHAAGPTIYLSNDSTHVTAEALADALPAFQASVTEDLAAWWGTDATLSLEPAPAGTWTVKITDTIRCFLCGGFHDLANGVPFAEVYPIMGDWQITLSHELQEMIVDPWVNRLTLSSRFWLVEVADPCEAFWYRRYDANGRVVKISDFVTPAWYRASGKAPFDFRGRLRRPFALGAGGYASYWDTAAGGWGQVFADRTRH